MADADATPAPVATGEPLPDDEARKRRAAAVDEAAIAAAFLLWKSAAPASLAELWNAIRDPENGPFLFRSVWRWLTRTRQFRRNVPGSAPLPRPEARAAVDDVVSESERRAEAAGAPLKSGAADVSAWQRDMEAVTRESIVAAAVIGAGGVRSFGPAERAVAETLVRFHHDKLAGFASEVAGGMPLDGAFDARARMYGAAGTAGYEEVLRRGDIDAGFLWERRILNAKQSCAECRAYAAEGWQRAGTLPALGDRCSCRSNCKCTFERSRSLRNPGDFSMPTETLHNRDDCKRRSRLAAKQGFEAAPLKFAGAKPPEMSAVGRLLRAKGTLPKDDGEATSRINAILGLADTPQALRADDLHIRYLEAGSSAFIPSRAMFLGKKTLANVAARATEGFAFMNSHRTGGLSSPSELPYGRTFAGRLETYATADGAEATRAVLGVYMLRGEKPNGDSGPTTDALARGIDAGTIFDVSLGLHRGKAVCDVCGGDLDETDDEGMPVDPHVPGTTRSMTKSEIKAQLARGVPGGVATYTLEDAEPGEVSAVFDGAVPGAGFRRFRSFARANLLTAHQLAEARLAYGHLLDVPRPSERRRRMSQRISLSSLRALLSGAGQADDDADDPEFEITDKPNVRLSAGAPQKPNAAVTELQNKIDALSEQLAASEKRRGEVEAKAEADRRSATFSAEAKDFVAGHKAANRLTAKQATDVERLHAQLAADDHANPAAFSRVACLSAVLADAKPFGKSADEVPNHTATLSNEGDSAFDAEAYAKAQNKKYLGNQAK